MEEEEESDTDYTENREDQSRKSSTAASAPKLRSYNDVSLIFVAGGPSSSSSSSQQRGGDKSKIKNLSGKMMISSAATSSSSAVQKKKKKVQQQGKSKIETSKNLPIAEEEESDNHHQPTTTDPRALLVHSILTLQSVQESLEREIDRFGEIGQEIVFLADPGTYELYSSGPLRFEEIEPSCLPHLEVQLVRLKQSVGLPESNSEEASAILKAKESRIEDVANRGESLKEEMSSCLKSLQGFREMEIELEDLIKQKIEAEVEYLVFTTSTQNFKVATADHFSFLEEQKSLVGEQTQMLQKLRDAESNVVLLKRQAEKLEASCGELLGTEEVLEMQNEVCKSTFCFLIQLILLFVAFGIFLLQLLPHSARFVPT